MLMDAAPSFAAGCGSARRSEPVSPPLALTAEVERPSA
jgi:hypothetical protein